MKLETVKTYVLHCKQLKERLLHIQRQLDKFNFNNITWFLDFDGNELTKDIVNKYYTMDFWYDRFLPELYNNKVGHKRALGLGSISLCIKHINVYDLMAKENDEYALLLEDDVVLHDNFNNIETYMQNAPSDWDMIFLGSGCGLRPKFTTPDQVFYKKESPSTKCTDSFLIKKEAATKLRDNMIPFSLPIDFELNYHLHVLGFNVYWIDPPIVSQGSELGMFNSTGK